MQMCTEGMNKLWFAVSFQKIRKLLTWRYIRTRGNLHIQIGAHDFPQSMCRDEFGPTYRHFVIIISFIAALKLQWSVVLLTTFLYFHKLHERKDITIIDTTVII